MLRGWITPAVYYITEVLRRRSPLQKRPWVHGGCGLSAENAYFSAAPDLTFAFVRDPCCPTLDFVFAFWNMITFYTLFTSLFCMLKRCREYTFANSLSHPTDILLPDLKTIMRKTLCSYQEMYKMKLFFLSINFSRILKLYNNCHSPHVLIYLFHSVSSFWLHVCISRRQNGNEI
jgi:hypothetical protein